MKAKNRGERKGCLATPHLLGMEVIIRKSWKSVVKPVLVTAITEVHSFQNLEIHAMHYIWKSALFFT